MTEGSHKGFTSDGFSSESEKCGNLPGKAIRTLEEQMAGAERILAELNATPRRRELKAQELCDYIAEQWRAQGCDNVPLIISGDYTIEALIRARELFLALPENQNMGDPKADFYMMMGRQSGNPYITLCVPGTVI